jgi:hypothetical protein
MDSTSLNLRLNFDINALAEPSSKRFLNWSSRFCICASPWKSVTPNFCMRVIVYRWYMTRKKSTRRLFDWEFEG